jgi:hypothetical protein
MVKKLLTILFIFVSLLLSSTTISFAQSGNEENPWNQQNDSTAIANYRAAITDDNCLTPSLECLVHQVFQFASIEFVNSTLFSDFVPPGTGGDSEDEDVKKGGNILQGTGKLIGTMYANPAAKTSVYVADIMNSAHITPQAYAQGLGFSSLNPILELWKAFRNLAYMFFIIIFMIIGFMIMFRQRIGGQAAVTAQQAIPGVIVSLIFVTFSYAIAGLLIDAMYLIMFLIIGVFGETVGKSLPGGGQNLIDLNIRQLGGLLMGAGGVPTIGQVIDGTAVGNPQDNIDLVSNLFSNLVDVNGNGDNLVAGVIGGLTLTVVLAIAILIGTIKLFFELLKSYASVIISVVTSPLILMMGAIPGKNPIVPWLKDLIGNLLPFPVVLLVLVIFFQFKDSGFADGNGAGGFMPPFLLNNGHASSIASLMGLALILALPEIVKRSKKGLVSDGGFGGIIFEAATNSAKSGWKGGELVPGWAATNTARLSGLGSGKDFARKGAMGVSAVAGGIAGSVYNRYGVEGGSAKRGVGVGARWAAQEAGTLLGDKSYNRDIAKERKAKAVKAQADREK